MTTKWTAVQHSGSNHVEFERAVEAVGVPNVVIQNTVLRAGGVLFDSYAEADAFCERKNHPPGASWLIPAADGTFSEVSVKGLRVYIPPKARATGRTIRITVTEADGTVLDTMECTDVEFAAEIDRNPAGLLSGLSIGQQS